MLVDICYGPFQLHVPFRPGAFNMCAVSTPFLGDKMARPFQHQSIYAQIITFRGHLKANGT